jgi:hypothetical protein
VSFDTLLTVVFVVVFIVLPLVSRVLRERNRPPTAQRGATPPRAPEGTVLDGTPPVAEGELPAWLAEAQRRVREARERAGARGRWYRRIPSRRWRPPTGRIPWYLRTPIVASRRGVPWGARWYRTTPSATLSPEPVGRNAAAAAWAARAYRR